MDFLYRIYGKLVVLIIDGYDVLLQKATTGGYYDQMLEIISGIFSSTLKGNLSLGKAYVTGSIWVAYQSIFTGANNFVFFDQRCGEYSDLIGFTLDEVRGLLEDCGMADRYDEVTNLYDGYTIGGRTILCPWSVLSFLSSVLTGEADFPKFKHPNYWANISCSKVVDIYLEYSLESDNQRLSNLVIGGTEEIDPQQFTTYPDIRKQMGFDTFATLLLHTGYLTYDRNTRSSHNEKTVVRIPNEELRQWFTEKLSTLFGRGNPN